MAAADELINPPYVNEINEHVIYPCIKSALAVNGKAAKFGDLRYYSNLPSADDMQDTANDVLVMTQPEVLTERLDVYQVVKETCDRAIGTEV